VRAAEKIKKRGTGPVVRFFLAPARGRKKGVFFHLAAFSLLLDR